MTKNSKTNNPPAPGDLPTNIHKCSSRTHFPCVMGIMAPRKSNGMLQGQLLSDWGERWRKPPSQFYKSFCSWESERPLRPQYKKQDWRYNLSLNTRTMQSKSQPSPAEGDPRESRKWSKDKDRFICVLRGPSILHFCNPNTDSTSFLRTHCVHQWRRSHSVEGIR